VLGSRRAIVVDDHVVAKHPLDRVPAAHRTGAAGEGGIREQDADTGEIAAVDELSVGSISDG
jgi:hypothetical protein